MEDGVGTKPMWNEALKLLKQALAIMPFAKVYLIFPFDNPNNLQRYLILYNFFNRLKSYWTKNHNVMLHGR